MIAKKIIKIKNKVSKNSDYINFLKKPIHNHLILLEGGQGKNINGNIFAFIKEISNNAKWKDMSIILVLTEETIDSARSRLEFYNFENIKCIIRNSTNYKYYLATCKYLITDNSFPPYFIKRDEQIYLNTWHGTPLKTLGICDIKNSTSLANVQKNYLMCDYALFPNYYMYNIFMEDYSLKNILQNKMLMCDYPRNVAFFDERLKENIKIKYSLVNKRVYAYMPTWRGSSRSANIAKQKEIILNYLNDIDILLNDNEILYVNLHFLIGNDIDLSSFQHIALFPQEYETYDFLNVCDVLITDYSSVFFDFAVTKKKIILFTYDLEEYITERGMYFSINKLPFPIVNTVERLIKEMHDTKYEEYDEFYNQYCMFASKSTTKNILDLLINNNEEKVVIKNPMYNGKENVFIHINRIISKNQALLLIDYLKNKKNENKNYICVFKGKITENIIYLVDNLPEDIQVFAYVSGLSLTFGEYIVNALALRSKFINICFKKVINNSLRREKNRIFPNIRIHEIKEFIDLSNFIPRIFNLIPVKKTIVNVPDIYLGTKILSKKYKSNILLMKNNFDRVEEWNYKIYSDEQKDVFYNLSINFMRLFSRIRVNDENIIYTLYFCQKNVLPVELENMNVYFGEKTFNAVLDRKISKKGYGINKLKIIIPLSDVASLNIQNKLFLTAMLDKELGFKKGVKYNSGFGLKKLYARSKIINVNNKTCAYFRKSANNFVFLTVRAKNVTDNFFENLKLNIAYCISKVIHNKNLILLFEKDSSRYEESASVVYEKLIDMKVNNCYYILDKKSKDLKSISKKYLKNIIYKYSFKHYLYFFMCKTFVGTEALVHVIELRATNKHVLSKIADKNNNYVFLQHGVMYMISLDSESRTFFKPRSIRQPGKYRVVVSSQIEANHFIELGGYDESQIIISGLPKYDRNQWYQSANKIVVMPTWRPWEYNEATTDFLKTKYYQMINRIFQAIPDKYKDNIVILPHPLFFDAAKDKNFELKKYMNFETKYDLILREAKILITDYSSIAYDAFYRGSNVIFFWEELEECLEHYGKSTKLMLNINNVFGDVCYNAEDLSNVVERNYLGKQSNIYQNRYKNIVTYDDGNNTNRLIEKLIRENIIKL